MRLTDHCKVVPYPLGVYIMKTVRLYKILSYISGGTGVYRISHVKRSQKVIHFSIIDITNILSVSW